MKNKFLIDIMKLEKKLAIFSENYLAVNLYAVKNT